MKRGWLRVGGVQQERRPVVSLEMQVARHAAVRDMHSEAEIRHHCRPGEDRGQ